MSSAETLTFGPQWLRELSSGGSKTSATSPPSPICQPISRFKLAENRYGREEMLALFVKDDEIPEELLRAPSLLFEESQIPLALTPTNDTIPLQSNGYRGRGGILTNARSRPLPVRGRGRGRGGVAWEEYDDFMPRKPPMLRRAESEDWRSDSLRGKGDGAEDLINGMKEWRSSGARRDPWRGDNGWREKSSDGKLFRSRSMSAKEHDPWSTEFTNPDDRPDLTAIGKPSNNIPIRRQIDTTGFPINEEKDHEIELSKEPDVGEEDPPDQTEVAVRIEEGLQVVTPTDIGLKAKVEESGPVQVTSPWNTSPQENRKNEARPFEETVSSGNSPLLQTPLTLSPIVQDHKGINSALNQQPIDPISIAESISQATSTRQISVPQSENITTSLGHLPQPSTVSPTPISQLQALATTWFYKDPQGETQGPFTSNQMMEWFNAGYFTMVLLVRRACDPRFMQLGELIKKLGFVPFQSPMPNPLLDQMMGGKQTNEMTNLRQQYQQYMQQQQQQQQQQLTQQDIGKWSFQGQSSFDPVISKSDDLMRKSQYLQQQYSMQHMGDLQSNPHVDSTIPGRNNHFERNSSEKDLQEMFRLREHELVSKQQSESFLKKQFEEAENKRKLLLEQESRRKEEEKIQRILREQEEQKSRLKRQEEELRRREEQLLREEGEMKRLQEAQEKQLKLEQHEAMQRKLKEEERRRQLEEQERRKKMEEEMRRQQEELERRRKIEEEMRRQQEELERRRQEEERMQRVWKTQRLEEARNAEEMRRMEETRRQEEARRVEMRAKQMEIQQEEIRQQKLFEDRKLLEERKQKELEAKRQKKINEEQIQQIPPLPASALWGQNQHPTQKSSLSLLEIQQIQEKKEQERHRVEELQMKTLNQHQQRQSKQTSVWKPATQTVQHMSGMSLLAIQQEEERQMARARVTEKIEQPVARDLGYGTLWNRPPKIQPDVAKINHKPQQQQQKKSESFWDQVMEEDTSNVKKQQQQQQQTRQQTSQPKVNNARSKKNKKEDEETKVKALFQKQASRDTFMEWCEDYLHRMNAGYIDIPTFVNFLRDVQCPYEVQEYVQSYLGESKDAREFAKLFLDKRNKSAESHVIPKAQKAASKEKSSGRQDSEGFKVVTGNSKRSKKKPKKSQKVDPSFLGFSVNAASDRVNMGEIQSTNE